MISAEENQLLTQTDRNTPCGELMRRYWQPVALSEELPAAAAPLKVRILGEDLVLFRDDHDRPGLLGLHRAHPCQEAVGVIFAYLGGGDPPLLPNYEFLTIPAEYRTVVKIYEDCNYLQGNEGNIDPVHLSYLHQCLDEAQFARRRTVPGSEATDNTLLGEDIAPTIEVEITDYGLRIYTQRNAGRDKRYLRVTNFVMPNLSVFGGSTVGAGYSIHWHVPIDDTHHWKYTFAF